MNDDHRCGTCRYYLMSRGECRRRAPQAVIGRAGLPLTLFPALPASDPGCCEFERMPDMAPPGSF